MDSPSYFEHVEGRGSSSRPAGDVVEFDPAPIADGPEAGGIEVEEFREGDPRYEFQLWRFRKLAGGTL